MMEVEQGLLAAIDRLAADGTEAEIRCLAAILSCSGKVERRVQGWQHPFQEYAERGGASVRQALDGLARRGIVVDGRRAITLDSYIMTRDKDFVCTVCAHRLFTKARRLFTELLTSISFADLKDLGIHPSTVAENRAYRNLGHRYWALRDMGLYVCSHRTNPRIFPTLRYMDEIPKVTGMALTLEQGRALTAKNLLMEVGVTYHLAVAGGYLAEGPDPGSCQLTERGRELATAYVVEAIRRRFGWVSQCRDEAMHFLVDELARPLPTIWMDARAPQMRKLWPYEAQAPQRILFKDWQLRAWIRQLVRRLKRMGLAERIESQNGSSHYYFAPGVAGLAKDALGLPEERFSLAPEFQERIAAFATLFPLRRDAEGRWLIQAEVPAEHKLLRETLREVKSRELASRRRDGSLMVEDPDQYRWALEEILLGPVMEFLATVPEPEAGLVGVAEAPAAEEPS